MVLKHVLITGDKGFVGSHFRGVLKMQGWNVIGLDIKRNPQEDCRFYFRSNPSNWYHFDMIIHCAAVVGGRETIEGDPMAIATDLSIDAELFNWALKTKQTCPIVYFSSSAVYPIRFQQSVFEEMKLKESMATIPVLRPEGLKDHLIQLPDMTYGMAKLMGEYQAQIARERYGLDVYVFRPFSGYGWDQDLAYPFPALVRRGVEKQDPFEIWGNGEQVRDWIHISDIVEAVLKAMEVKECGPVNLCSGIGITFKELAELVCYYAGYKPLFDYLWDKPKGVHYRVGSPEKMNQFFTPRIILHEGVEEAFQKWGNRLPS